MIPIVEAIVGYTDGLKCDRSNRYSGGEGCWSLFRLLVGLE